ncbi:hypothetical protein [Streptomyces himalayensis]|uniref:hypothetical protein n=1 Tax=Streptomyces himalayensis TaxID=2820085 RepID=UPI0028B13DEC|nr:hypothetical protein [Streptomyces himalayensis]
MSCSTGMVDLVVTSPPNGASAHGQVRSTRDTGERGVVKKDYRYSRDPANLAHVGLEQLLEAFTGILIQCRHMLRPGGHAVITTRPWRERGDIVRGYEHIKLANVAAYRARQAELLAKLERPVVAQGADS